MYSVYESTEQRSHNQQNRSNRVDGKLEKDQHKTITTENCCLCDNIFLFLYLRRVRSTAQKMLHAHNFQLSNLIIHMQICKWDTKTKKPRKRKLPVWRIVQCTSNVHLDRVFFTCVSAGSWTVAVWTDASPKLARTRCRMRAFDCASNWKRENDKQS